jgi:chorismate mutase
MGAVERLHSANIEKLGVIHRGFSSYKKTMYRNLPEWQIAIDLQSKFPDLPIINDPSHISGRRDLIFDVSQTALDLNFDGLMIETHCDPDNAWSDAAQQVTPERLVEIFKTLKVRNPGDDEAEFHAALNQLRSQIDLLDSSLLDTMGDRVKVAKSIGQLKKDRNVAVLQSNRWNEILGRMILEGEQRGLSEEFVLKLFKSIHQESIRHQEKIMKQ